MKTAVIAIYDIGKTNKKLFLCDERYGIVFERSIQLPETMDEDGFPCEDLEALTAWVGDIFEEASSNKSFDIKAVQFSAYGASFVLLDKVGFPVAPLYNYLKPYPERLSAQFYDRYGGKEVFSRKTASPVLGSLNSGLQLYRLKYEAPDLFKKVRYALHLPQYISFLFSGQFLTDVTSVGCHTNLWNFETGGYHEWVNDEGMASKLPPITSSICLYNSQNGIVPKTGRLKIGVGMHDSSAALIPYLAVFKEPFVLISTGTWNISMNPFNSAPLTDDELRQDCLQYLSFEGRPVKAARLFSGREHEDGVKKLSLDFTKPADYYKNVRFDPSIVEKLKKAPLKSAPGSGFENYETAYHSMMIDQVDRQIRSSSLVFSDSPPVNIFVDGGFSKNDVFMRLLAARLPRQKVFAASVAQASAIGAALAMHDHWNPNPLPPNLININTYTGRELIP